VSAEATGFGRQPSLGKIVSWIEELSSREMGKDEVTFGDLLRDDVPEDAEPVFHYELQVIVSDVTER
jgi:hypothetical protein